MTDIAAKVILYEAGFGQNSRADLRRVGTSHDMDEIVFRFRIEPVLAREFDK